MEATDHQDAPCKVDEINDGHMKKAVDIQGLDDEAGLEGTGIRSEDEEQGVLQDDRETEGDHEIRLHSLSQDAVEKKSLKQIAKNE